MNLEQWLQLRREGRLAAMPLGMRMAMSAFGDMCSIGIYNYDDLGQGSGWSFPENGCGYGDGFVGNSGNGHGNCRIPFIINGKEWPDYYFTDAENSLCLQGDGVGYGNNIDGNLLHSLVIEEIIQR